MRAFLCHSRCVWRVEGWDRSEGWGGCKARMGAEVVHASSPKVEFSFLSLTRTHSQHRTAEVYQLCPQLGGPPEMMLQSDSSWVSCRTQQSCSSAADGLLPFLSLSVFLFGLQGEINNSLLGGKWMEETRGDFPNIHTKGSGNKALNGPKFVWLSNWSPVNSLQLKRFNNLDLFVDFHLGGKTHCVSQTFYSYIINKHKNVK